MLTTPGDRTVVTCSPDTAPACPGAASGRSYYLFEHEPGADPPVPQMTGDMLKLDGTRQDFDSSGAPIVTLQFTHAGDERFHDITRDEAIRGRALGVDQHFAIVLDGELRSWPQIDYRRFPDGIDPAGGGAEIDGLPSVGEAKALAVVLQTGALPVEFRTVERTDVSATLGADSLRQARERRDRGARARRACSCSPSTACSALVAVLGLAVYAALMYGAILLLGVTLTLPGFAGLILTIGVAADANIVVFERIREETRRGRSVRAAIAAGYAKGLRTIVDANAVTCITALVLFAVATASVRGLRADAADRHGRLARHRGRRDARDARTARRASRGSTTRASWARPRASSRAGCAGTSSADAGCGSSSRSPRSRVSVVALAVEGPEPRHRLPGRRAGDADDAEADVARGGARRRLPTAARVVQGTRQRDRHGRLPRLPDPPARALAGRADDARRRPAPGPRRRSVERGRRTSRRASAVRFCGARSWRSSCRLR